MFRFSNVASFTNGSFAANTQIVVSRENGLFAPAESPATDIDATGYLLLPGFVDGGIIGGKEAINSFRGPNVSLEQALKKAVSQGTTVAVTANFDSCETMDLHKLPLNITYDLKAPHKDSNRTAFTSSGAACKSLQLTVSPTVSELSGMVDGSVFASGQIAISETPSVWPFLKEESRKLGVFEYDVTETSKLAVGLRDLLLRVTERACTQLKLEESRGTISTGAIADFILIKLDPEWELSTVGE